MSEKKLHTAVCQYLDLQYPDVIYTTDASGLRLSMGLRMEMKRKRCKKYVIPDLIILHPSKFFRGCFIEIKQERSDVYLKNGEIKNDKHVRAQHASIERLKELGYAAAFGCGWDECKQIIDNYLN